MPKLLQRHGGAETSQEYSKFKTKDGTNSNQKENSIGGREEETGSANLANTTKTRRVKLRRIRGQNERKSKKDPYARLREINPENLKFRLSDYNN